jgi:hypothetical protein
MPRFAERDWITAELVVSRSQILFTSMALLLAASIIWVFFERLLYSP